ncbi:hypothetical protein [Streptomyces sp. G44]|nr:hypothetical protein [Streptomyces sp. G44]
MEPAGQAYAATTAMPDDAHEEVLALIDSVAGAPDARPGHRP